MKINNDDESDDDDDKDDLAHHTEIDMDYYSTVEDLMAPPLS